MSGPDSLTPHPNTHLNIYLKLRVHPLIKAITPFFFAGLFVCLIFWFVKVSAHAQSSFFSIIKTTSAETVRAGEPFTYTIRVLNTSSLKISVDISDPIPSNMTVTNRGSGTLSEDKIQWLGLSVDPVSTVAVNFTVVVTEAGQIVNSDYQATSGTTTEFGAPVTTTIIANNPARVTISTNPSSIPVNTSSMLTISVTDSYGNGIADNTPVAIDFDLGRIDGYSAGTTVTGTTTSGQLVKSLVAETNAGTAHITATVGSIKGTGAVAITAGAPTSLTVIAAPPSISTVNGQTAMITATITDQYGNPAAQTPVTVTTSLGNLNNGGAIAALQTTDGQAVVTLAGTVAGTAHITAVTGNLIDTSQSVYLAPGPPTYINLRANPGTIIANNGISTTTVTLSIFDENDNLVDSPVPVTITTSLGVFSNGITSHTETTTNGKVQTTLVALTQTGQANLQAFASGLNTDTSVNFISGPPASISLEIAPTAIPADGISTATLTAAVRDTFGNLVDSPVTLTFIVDSGTLLEEATDTATSGVLIRTLRSDTILGTVPITVTTPDIITPATGIIEFVVGAPSAANISSNPTSPITAGVSSQITLTIYDSAGHLVPDSPITVTSSLGTISPSSTGTTDESGQLQRTLVSTQAGNTIVRIYGSKGELNVTGGSISFIPDEATQAILQVQPNQIVADGSTTGTVIATLTDRFGNPVSGVTPNFTISPALGSFIGSDATNASGVTTRILQSTTDLGLAIISLSNLPTVTNAIVSFVTGPPDSVILSAEPVSTQVAQNVTLVMTVTDRVGHPIVGETLTVTSTIGTVSGCGATNSQGIITCTLYSTKSGQPQVYVAGVAATGDTVIFNPGDLHHIKVIPFGTISNPVDTSAGISFDFDAQGEDIYNNPIPGTSFIWSTNSAGGEGTINASSGEFVGTTAGLVRVKASAAGKTGVSYAEVGPGTPAITYLKADRRLLSANGTDIANLTFYVTDIYGNEVGFGIPLTVTSSTGIVEGTNTTDSTSQAYRTIRSTQAGLAHINVTNLISVTGQMVITFTPGSPAKAVVSALATSLPANGVAQTTLNITLVDNFNNPVGTGLVPTVQSSLGTLSGGGSTNANGTITCTLTAPTTVGTTTFTVRYSGLPLQVSGDKVRFVVGPLDHLKVTPGGPLSVQAGQPIDFTVQGYDVDNAPIPDGINYSWELISTGSGSGTRDTQFGQQTTFIGTTTGSGVNLIAAADENGAYYEESVSLTVVPGPPIAATIIVSPTVVTADGISPVSFTLTNLTDVYNNAPIDGTVVTLTVQSQPVSRTSVAAVSNEQVNFVFAAITQAGTYPVSAYSSLGEMDLVGSKNITFTPGSLAKAEIISATPAQIIANNTSTSTIVIQLRDAYNNKVTSGLLPVVTTTLGTVLANDDPTDSNGVLTRTLQADLGIGDAQIYVNGIIASNSMISLIPGPPVSATITVITSTLAAGGDNTTVIFSVYDMWGHHVANGTTITPTLTPVYGTLSGITQTVNGLITQTLLSGTSVGTATLNSYGIIVTGDTILTFIPGLPAIAQMTAMTTLLTVGEATNLTITVTDAYSNTVLPTVITTTAALGILDGISSTITQTTANSSGSFSTTLSSTVAGTETLAFTGLNGPLTVRSDSDVVVFLPGDPIDVTLAPTGSVTVTAGVPLTVTVSSRDSYGNAIDPWTPVNYTWRQSASVESPGYGTLNGIDIYGRSIKFKPIKIGTNQLWATGGVKNSNVLTVNTIAGPPTAATVTVTPKIVPANGVSTYTITVTNVTDAFGNPNSEGTPLTVTVQSFPAIVGTRTTVGGKMVLTLPSSTEAGTHNIHLKGKAGSLTLNGDTSVTFTPGAPVRAVVDAIPESIPGDGVSTASLQVSVYDDYLNLVSNDIPITVTTDLGTITGNDTTITGKVNRTLHAPIGLGTANFSVEGPDGPLFVLGDSVQFVPGAPVFASVTASSVQVLADGISTSQITIVVKDGHGFTVENSKIAVMSAVRGSLMPTITVASMGSFTTTFTADTSVGLANLSITYDGLPLQIVGDLLELIPGPAISATISANPTSLKVGSNNTSILTVNLFDTWGHSVADGTVVTLTTSLGSILPGNSTTVDGFVTRTLTPGNTIGTTNFTVKASPSIGSLSLSGDKVTITAGDLDHIDILPTGSVQVVAGNQVSFSAVGRDALGNEVGTGQFDWQLWATSGDGILSNEGVFTGTIAGSVGIQASQVSIFSPIKTITVQPGAPITAVVSANPIIIPAGGATTELTITARDAYGNLIANGTSLNLTTNLGTLIGTSASQKGVLTRTLRSDGFYGVVDLFVNGWEAGGDNPVIVPKAQVTANPSSLLADGISETELTIQVFNLLGGLVPDGTSPTITTTLGMLMGKSSTINGILTRTLRAPLMPGVAQMYVNGTLAEGEVTFGTGSASVAYIDANPPYLSADGASNSILTITVQDDYGHVITDAGPLTVSTTRGTISAFQPTTNGVTTRILTADSMGGAANISVAGLSVAGNSTIHFVDTLLDDGSFESGDLNNWAVGRVITIGEETTTILAYDVRLLNSDTVGNISITPISGNNMVRLGATTSDKRNHRLSEAWLNQPIQIQSGGVTQLTFWYRLLSYDVSVGSAYKGFKEYDPFEVRLNDQEVLQDGYAWSAEWQEWYSGQPTSPKDKGWQQGVLDLTPYAGQIVTIEFRVPNREVEADNTWVYIDDVNLTYRETKVHKTYLPLILQ